MTNTECKRFIGNTTKAFVVQCCQLKAHISCMRSKRTHTYKTLEDKITKFNQYTFPRDTVDNVYLCTFSGRVGRLHNHNYRILKSEYGMSIGYLTPRWCQRVALRVESGSILDSVSPVSLTHDHIPYLSLGSIHVVLRVLWSMKNTFPSTSPNSSQPSGSAISPSLFRGIFTPKPGRNRQNSKRVC